MATPTTSRGITETDVWQAADALLLEGARPTIERVRNKIGRGSPNTVSPHLETWFRSLGARIADPNAFAAPPTLPDPISQAAQHFWETALAAARSEVTTALRSEREDIATERECLAAERSQLVATKVAMETQAQAQQDSMAMLREQATEAAGGLRMAQGQIAARESTIETLRQQVAQLYSDRDALRETIDRERAAHEVMRQEWETRTSANESRWASEVDRARESTKSVQAKLSKLEKESAERVHELTGRLGDTARDVLRLSTLSDSAQQELDRLRPEYAVALTASKELEARLKARETEYTVQLGHLQAQLSAALSQLSVKDSEHGALLRELIATTTRKTENHRGKVQNRKTR